MVYVAAIGIGAPVTRFKAMAPFLKFLNAPLAAHAKKAGPRD